MDRGVAAVPWTRKHLYQLNQVIQDVNTHVQQVISAGTSADSNTPPVFSTSNGITNDNVVVWTNQGVVGSNLVFVWQQNTQYPTANTSGPNTAEIVDAVNHVQLATNTTPGTSGPGPNPPASVKGGKPVDGLICTAQGP